MFIHFSSDLSSPPRNKKGQIVATGDCCASDARNDVKQVGFRFQQHQEPGTLGPGAKY